ncbi:MAG TPA: FAD-dependent oxidoreductase [Candidatus Nanoarchaeia archaeon]|nr:FAD-dependent oxidoreductase [Candidatus Nanoarchaeia archaeon]
MTITKISSPVSEIIEETPTVRSFLFPMPPEFSFEPGQYVNILAEIDGKITRRSYSIARKVDHAIEITLNLVQNGLMSKHLHSMKLGDIVQITGPLGVFVLKKDSAQKDNTFIATGTGVTPFVAMIEKLLSETRKNVTLFAGYKHEEEILFDDFFKELQKKHKNFNYHVAVSRDTDFKGEKHVQELMEKYLPSDFSGDVYLCGLFDMIKDVGLKLTKEWKLPKEKIIFERYD